MRTITLLCAAALVLAPGAALAGPGRAGLWNIATTMNMAISLPPAALARMKASGAKIPGPRTVTSQVCMTQAQVDAATPPPVAGRQRDCSTHVTARSATAMTADMVCKGPMAGTGHIQVAYQGAEHYAGSYSFAGTQQGRPVRNSMRFRGDWVQADCGAVKPAAPLH